MKNENIQVSYGEGWVFPIFLIFLVLKLSGTVDWSWWIVTLPLWIGPALILGVLLGILAVVIVFGICYGAFSVVCLISDYIQDRNYARRRKERLK